MYEEQNKMDSKMRSYLKSNDKEHNISISDHDLLMILEQESKHEGYLVKILNQSISWCDNRGKLVAQTDKDEILSQLYDLAHKYDYNIVEIINNIGAFIQKLVSKYSIR